MPSQATSLTPLSANAPSLYFADWELGLHRLTQPPSQRKSSLTRQHVIISYSPSTGCMAALHVIMFAGGHCTASFPGSVATFLEIVHVLSRTFALTVLTVDTASFKRLFRSPVSPTSPPLPHRFLIVKVWVCIWASFVVFCAPGCFDSSSASASRGLSACTLNIIYTHNPKALK